MRSAEIDLLRQEGSVKRMEIPDRIRTIGRIRRIVFAWDHSTWFKPDLVRLATISFDEFSTEIFVGSSLSWHRANAERDLKEKRANNERHGNYNDNELAFHARNRMIFKIRRDGGKSNEGQFLLVDVRV